MLTFKQTVSTIFKKASHLTKLSLLRDIATDIDENGEKGEKTEKTEKNDGDDGNDENGTSSILNARFSVSLDDNKQGFNHQCIMNIYLDESKTFDELELNEKLMIFLLEENETRRMDNYLMSSSNYYSSSYYNNHDSGRYNSNHYYTRLIPKDELGKSYEM